MKNDFAHVNHWIFDLDNTLYPPEAALFDQIEVRMTDYVIRVLRVDRAEANHLRKKYWRQYGTTLSGLMREHGVDPEPYLVDVHQIDLGHLEKAPDLRRAIAALPGRKIVYTNGSKFHAERVIDARGLNDVFDAVYGIEHAGYFPKPERQAFELICARDSVDSTCATMFEDDSRNLAEPFEMGMKTVLVGDHDAAAHVHYHTDDLSGFLSRLGV
jgi:putative hydrolase of the HAD superfamily